MLYSSLRKWLFCKIGCSGEKKNETNATELFTRVFSINIFVTSQIDFSSCRQKM